MYLALDQQLCLNPQKPHSLGKSLLPLGSPLSISSTGLNCFSTRFVFFSLRTLTVEGF